MVMRKTVIFMAVFPPKSVLCWNSHYVHHTPSDFLYTVPALPHSKIETDYLYGPKRIIV